MSDIPSDNTQLETSEAAPAEKLSPAGIAAAQGETDDAYRRLLEKQIEDSVKRLPDYKDDPNNLAALKADITDANERLMKSVQEKHGVPPEEDPPPDPADQPDSGDNLSTEHPARRTPEIPINREKSPETEPVTVPAPEESVTDTGEQSKKPEPPEGWTPGIEAK